MKAAVVEALNEVRVREVQDPELLAGSMKVKVMACGVCGSDIRIFTRGDSRATFPRIIGHEIAGEIVEVGTDAPEQYRLGDRVCVAPIHGCGECRYCLAGQGNICVNPQPAVGYASSGGFAEYIVPPENVVRAGGVNHIPEGLSFAEASMSELVAACINGQEKVGTHSGDTVLIMGAGPAGCMHVQIAKARGASKVILADPLKHRVKMAKRVKPEVAVCMSDEDLAARLKAETGGLGADVIIVAAPSAAAQEDALDLVAPGGRISFFGGLPKDDCHVTIDSNRVHYQEIVITGASSTLGRQNAEALRLLSEGKVNAADYITHRFGLDDIRQAFQTVIDKKAIKAVVFPWGTEM